MAPGRLCTWLELGGFLSFLIHHEATLPKSRSGMGLAKALPPVADFIEFVSKPTDSIGFAAQLVKGAEAASLL